MNRLGIATVMFVDDEPSILSALRRLLHDEPYKIVTYESPTEALVAANQDPPAVVVADYHMPGMTGPELLQGLRRLNENIVRIILTGKPDVTAVLDAVELGAVYRFLLKPWDEDELRVSLRRAVDHHCLLDERTALQRRIREQERRLASLQSNVEASRG